MRQGRTDGRTDGKATVHLPPWVAGGHSSSINPSTREQHPPWAQSLGVASCSWAAPSLVLPSQNTPIPPVGTQGSPLIPGGGGQLTRGAPAPMGAYPKDGHLGEILCRGRWEGRRTPNFVLLHRPLLRAGACPAEGEQIAKQQQKKKKIYTAVFSSVHLRSKPTPGILISASPGRGEGTS